VIIFKHACKLGCEGIVSKRLGSQIARADRQTGSRSRTRRRRREAPGRRGLGRETQDAMTDRRFPPPWTVEDHNDAIEQFEPTAAELNRARYERTLVVNQKPIRGLMPAPQQKGGRSRPAYQLLSITDVC
jgi:hypothetical protein